MNRFIAQFQVVTTNNYNTIVIYTLCNSIDHTVYVPQSATRHFLATVPTIAIPLPLPHVLSSQTVVQD
jgi:hypothetical protein